MKKIDKVLPNFVDATHKRWFFFGSHMVFNIDNGVHPLCRRHEEIQATLLATKCLSDTFYK